MRILHLTLKKKWFDMVSDSNIETRKDEEYREVKRFWVQRLCNEVEWEMNGTWEAVYKKFDAVCFHWGYKKNHPTCLREWKGIEIGTAKPEWSDNWQGEVFKIKLGNIITTSNVK